VTLIVLVVGACVVVWFSRRGWMLIAAGLFE
jgi:hypothetical protein